MKKLDLLVVGTGRCGTVYLANFLSSIGMPCGHEAIFTTGGIKEAIARLKNPKLIKFSNCTDNITMWTIPENIVADSSYMSAPFLNTNILSNTKTIHLIRNPIKVIQSFVNAGYFGETWPEHTISFQNFIKCFVPIVYDNDLNAANRAAIYYIEWNNLIQKNIKNHIIHKIEDDTLNIFNYLNIQPHEVSVNEQLNSWPTYNNFYLSQLSTEIKTKLMDFAEKYRYNLMDNKIHL